MTGWRSNGLTIVALPSYLGLCLILGGASAAGLIPNAIIQLIAVVILVACAWPRRPVKLTRAMVFEPGHVLVIAVAVWAFLWPAVQLVPLPPAIWRALPGHGFVAESDDLLGVAGAWRPISLQPLKTMASLLAMLPPLATFVLALRSGDLARRAAILTLLVVALVSSVLGIIQLAQGPGGSAYFYTITNSNTSVGFFANSNHLATLFLVVGCFAADLPYAPSQASPPLHWQIIRVGIFLFALLNLLLNRSFAGLFLAAPMSLFFLARTPLARRLQASSKLILPLFIAGGAILAGLVAWAANGLVAKVAVNMTDSFRRLIFYRNTFKMIHDTLPFGSGLGTFRWLYAGSEPIDKLTMTYVNHAHNDYLEMISDLGFAAILTFVGLAVWYGWRLLRPVREVHAAYVPASAMALLLIAAHSFVDYPLRTAAMACAAALCIGMMTSTPEAEPAPRPRKIRA